MAKFDIQRESGESKGDYRRRYRREWERATRLAKGLPVRIVGEMCSQDDCQEKPHAKGLCKSHYRARWMTLRKERGEVGTGNREHPLYMMWWERKDRGSLCPEWASDFLAFVNSVGERPSSTHLLRPLHYGTPYGPENFEWLDALKREPGETKKAFIARKWASRRERFPSYESRRSLKRKYNLTPDEYDTMHEAQGGTCCICRKEETRINPKTHAPQALAVDHCHARQHVRGLLCWRCNTTLGKVEDSTDLLRAMIRYLEAGVGDVI